MADQDPAQTSAERRRRVEVHINAAGRMEAELEGSVIKAVDEALEAIASLETANNHRLKAICEHLGLRGPTEDAPIEPEGEDPAVEDGRE